MKKKLQDVTNYKIMSFEECVEALNWKIIKDDEELDIQCDCEHSEIEYSGFFGTEVIECKNCGKKMIDIFSPLQTGNSTCTILNPSDYELEKDINGAVRYWIVDDSNKGIKIKKT